MHYGNDVDAGEEALAIQDEQADVQDVLDVNMDDYEEMLLNEPEIEHLVAEQADVQDGGDAVDAWNFMCWAKCRDEKWGPFTSWV